MKELCITIFLGLACPLPNPSKPTASHPPTNHSNYTPAYWIPHSVRPPCRLNRFLDRYSRSLSCRSESGRVSWFGGRGVDGGVGELSSPDATSCVFGWRAAVRHQFTSALQWVGWIREWVGFCWDACSREQLIPRSMVMGPTYSCYNVPSIVWDEVLFRQNCFIIAEAHCIHSYSLPNSFIR